ncbi:MAG: hypothetical protein HYS13_16660 [Planctomycetia bacterium]|nr:hypothetical protein [Planctomycetia bacterium]
MTRLTIDDSLCAKLYGFAGPVELCDASGRIVGQFVPSPQSTAISRPEDGCPHTEEELQAARREKGGRPLAEIWKSLGRT